MNLSWADRRLGAVRDEVVSVSRAATINAPESEVDVHVVRAADCAGTAEAGAAPVEAWEVAWRRSLSMQRALRERQYCEQIRDAKAAGVKPLTADEFFGTRDTILEL